MKEQAKDALNDAMKNLSNANKELFRPEEDVVSYSVCKNSQFAIENYLKGFLLKKNVDPSNYTTIDSLFEQCIKINPKFKKLELLDLRCKTHKTDSRYCTDISSVSNCFDVADSLDTFLRQEKII